MEKDIKMKLKDINSIKDVKVGSVVKSVLGYELPIASITDDYITLVLKKDYITYNSEGDAISSDMKFRAHFTTFKLVK